ncbi:hypothetical protein Dimus_006260 [Dionaea muscipula]
MVEKAVEKAVDRAKENDMQFDVEEPVHQVEEQDVDGNAQDTDVASKDTDIAAVLLLTDLAAVTSIGTTAATSVGNIELLAADISATLVPATDVSATMDDRTGDGQNQMHTTSTPRCQLATAMLEEKSTATIAVLISYRPTLAGEGDGHARYLALAISSAASASCSFSSQEFFACVRCGTRE